MDYNEEQKSKNTQADTNESIGKNALASLDFYLKERETGIKYFCPTGSIVEMYSAEEVASGTFKELSNLCKYDPDLIHTKWDDLEEVKDKVEKEVLANKICNELEEKNKIKDEYYSKLGAGQSQEKKLKI